MTCVVENIFSLFGTVSFGRRKDRCHAPRKSSTYFAIRYGSNTSYVVSSNLLSGQRKGVEPKGEDSVFCAVPAFCAEKWRKLCTSTTV